MEELKVKSKYRDVIVGYNGRSDRLGNRDDLLILYEIALETKSKRLLEFFEETPTKHDLKEIKTKNFLKKYEKKI